MIQKLRNIPKHIALSMIRVYQKILSPDQSFWAQALGTKVCIHEPTCSNYTYHAIQKHGVFKGSVMGFFRILRCNPWSRGGHDPVPETFSIRSNYQQEHKRKA